MITKEMQGKISCRGMGFNCSTCKDRYECVDCTINNMSSVEIKLFNHENGKILCETLSMDQLEHILEVLNPKGWS